MSFDKVKIRRNAERFLAQGKIKAAINEYKQVVENDPKDFTTLNIVGELYVKNSEPTEAIKCFTLVAEHFSRQGFAQKAIAIYNKILRLQPDSIDIISKLAKLYRSRGSSAEARTHYTTLAELYQKKGQKIEALAIWKEIAELDPNNTEIYTKIAETYRQEKQFEEAVSAFVEGGLRLAKQNQHEKAINLFSQALEISPGNLTAINALIKSKISLGYTDEAAQSLEEILVQQPTNKEVIYLLSNCYLDLNKPSDAERVILKLIEREPANYPKLLELVEVYLKNNDSDSATRILSMVSENLLAGGQSPELLKWLNEILARNPERIDALRLLTRVYHWNRNEAELKQTLERLAEAARQVSNIEEERSAITQLVMMMPQEQTYAARLQEIGNVYEPDSGTQILSNQSEKALTSEIPSFENYATLNDEGGLNTNAGSFEKFESFQDFENGYSEFKPEFVANGNGTNEYLFEANGLASEKSNHQFQTTGENINSSKLKPSDELKIQDQAESIKFYIEQGYRDLAEKDLQALENSFGSLPQIAELRVEFERTFNHSGAPQNNAVDQSFSENAKPGSSPRTENQNENEFKDFDYFKSELGFDSAQSDKSDEDYETHYHLAIAYQEMGLMEEAIEEYQDAINLVNPDDGTRRFFQCANLLGHCFMEKQMPNLALMWFSRALKTSDLNEDERKGLIFEIANAYEVGGEREKAAGYFEEIYATDANYREVGKRLEDLREVNLAS